MNSLRSFCPKVNLRPLWSLSRLTLRQKSTIPKPQISQSSSTTSSPSEVPEWRKRKMAVAKKYGQWNPTKRLNYQLMQDIRSMKEQVPHMKVSELASHFKVSPEAIRRILKSRWIPKDDEVESLLARQERRKERALSNKHELLDQVKLKHQRISYARAVTVEPEFEAPQQQRSQRPQRHLQSRPRQREREDHEDTLPKFIEDIMD